MKKKTLIFISISLAVAVIAFLVALRLTPWLYAINTRVRLYMDAPSTIKVNICWDEKRTECLPLVPYSSTSTRIAQKEEIADIWLSELPPRPEYLISLQFESGVHQASFHKLELDSSNIFLEGYGKENGAGVHNLQLELNEFEPTRISTTISAVGNLESNENGLLVYSPKIESGPTDHSRDWLTTLFIWVLLLFSIYLWIALPIFLLPNAVQNVASADFPTPLAKYSWPIYVGCIAIGIIMVLLVINSGVLIHQYDPLNYLSLATGSGWFNISRLPGYPLFLGLALLLSGYSLDGIILLQAVILASSVLFCLWTLQKGISSYAAIPFVLLSLFSPAQVNFARWILRESLFASLVLLGVTAVIAHFTGPKPYSNRWLIFFTVICGLAFLVRENGIIVPFALLPVLAIETIRRLFSAGKIGTRIRSVLLFLPRYILPFVAIAIIYVSFGFYNYFQYGYFQLEEQQTSHGFLSKAMTSANFDARGLLIPLPSMDSEAKEYVGWQLYSSYILARDLHPEVDQTYSTFYPAITAQMNERGVPARQFTVFHQASLLNKIGKNVGAFISKRAVLAGLLRQYILLLYPNDQKYPFKEVDISNAPVFLKTLPVNIEINEEKAGGVNNLFSDYYQTTEHYQWYPVLFALALLFSFYILKYENPVFLAPMAVYLANCALVLYSRMVAARVFVNIDILLVLQIALGFSVWLYRTSYAKREINL